MKKEQLAERIGNIDAEFIQDAEHIQNYTKQHQKKVVRRLSVFAAVIALMVCSIGVGAVAFALSKKRSCLIRSVSQLSCQMNGKENMG